jgi:hypothetical protein
MKKLIVAGFITTLFACSNTNEFDANLDAKVSQPSASDQRSVQQNNSTTPMPLSTQPVSTQPVVTTAPATTTASTVTTQTATTTAAGMNSPHGQPGHRCDIAVGAPLNSAPKTTTKTSTVPNQNITVTPVTPTTQNKTAAGMNPAHGQPGHRCDIAVGAPLNSAPAKPGTTTQVTPVKPEETKPTAADQWKVDIKPENKPAQKDSSRN